MVQIHFDEFDEYEDFGMKLSEYAEIGFGLFNIGESLCQ